MAECLRTFIGAKDMFSLPFLQYRFVVFYLPSVFFAPGARRLFDGRGAILLLHIAR